MTPEQYKAIRRKFFPDDPVGFLVEMGYEADRTTLRTRARRWESGRLKIPGNVARFVWLLEQWSIQGCLLDPKALPDELPAWPEDL